MSISQPPDHRYLIDNIQFVPGDILTIAFTDQGDPAGPVLTKRVFAEIDCVAGDMREQLWDIMEALCDLIDGSHQAQRDAERARR